MKIKKTMKNIDEGKGEKKAHLEKKKKNDTRS